MSDADLLAARVLLALRAGSLTSAQLDERVNGFLSATVRLQKAGLIRMDGVPGMGNYWEITDRGLEQCPRWRDIPPTPPALVTAYQPGRETKKPPAGPGPILASLGLEKEALAAKRRAAKARARAKTHTQNELTGGSRLPQPLAR